MKTLWSILSLAFLMSAMLQSQVPSGFTYQAILHGADGKVMDTQGVTINIILHQGSATGTEVFNETHTVTTNNFGLVVLNIGSENPGGFAVIDWTNGSYFMEVKVNSTSIGTTQLLTVPYAMHSNTSSTALTADYNSLLNKPDIPSKTSQLTNDAGFLTTEVDGSVANEIQDLQISNDVLTITGKTSPTPISLTKYLNQWNTVSSGINYTNGRVGIGMTNPSGMLAVQGTVAAIPSDTLPLFEVKNKSGETVFAVYNNGAVLYVTDEAPKGGRGGFAVGSRKSSKGTVEDIMLVTPDSVRIYIEDPAAAKGGRGGFAVGGRTPTKGVDYNYLFVSPDSSRIYINDDPLKGGRGGFAVGGRTPISKGAGTDYLRITPDSTRVYINEYDTKGGRGGFAVGGRSTSSKGTLHEYMRISYDSSRIYTFNDSLGFGVANKTSAYSGSYVKLNPLNYSIGHESGISLKPRGDLGKYNSFIGFQSGKFNADGKKNVMIGYQSGYTSNGSFNVFIGNETGMVTTGDDNVFVGEGSGKKNTGGNGNAFLGYLSGSSNTTGYYNTFLGRQAGTNNTEGSFNLCIGQSSGGSLTTGRANVFIGAQTGVSITGDSNVCIGYQAGFLETGSNKLYINNSKTNPPLIYGEFKGNKQVVILGTSANNSSHYNFYVNGTAGGSSSWNSLSDVRLKKNIRTIPDALNTLMNMRGVSFEWADSNSPEKGERIGFIAQELEKVLPQVVNTGGDYYSVQYGPINAILVEAVKEQQKMIQSLQMQTQTLMKENEAIKADLQKLNQSANK